MEETRNPPPWLDALTGLVFVAAMILIPVGIIGLQVQSATEQCKSILDDAFKPHKSMTGTVESVESWDVDSDVVLAREGSVTFTLTNDRERCRIKFTDGRSKELIRVPVKPLPTDREITIEYSKYDVYLGWKEPNSELSE